MFFNLKKFSVIVMSVVMLLSCAIPTYAQTNNAGTQTDTFFTGTVERPVSDGIWNYDAVTDAWTYTSSKPFKNTWAYITNPWNENKPAWFYFDGTGKMLTGWQKLYWNGSYKYFYFHEAKDGQRGELLVSGVTPDGYTVDENGVWTVDGVAQQYFSQTSGSGSSGPRTIKEESKTIADLLPDDFPNTDDPVQIPQNAWKGNGSGGYQICTGVSGKTQLYFVCVEGIMEHRWYLPCSYTVTKNGEDYVNVDGERIITFHMSDGKLASIEIVGFDSYDGTYTPPQNKIGEETLTIGDVLPDDFPTTNDRNVVPEGAWESENGDYINYCYRENDTGMVFNTEGIDIWGQHYKSVCYFPLSLSVTKNDGNYISGKYTFVMSEGELIQIEIHNDDEISEIYAPPGPPEPPYEGPTIASILPDDFPTTDYWSTVPEGAWVADNGNHCYKENDKGLDFFREGYDEYGNWVKQSSQLYLSRPVTKDDSGNYICDGTVFVMEDDKLIRIEYTPGFVTDGIFTPPQNKIGEETLTIADILPKDFPTTNDRFLVPGDAWVANNRKFCYIENDTLLDFYHDGYTEDGHYYSTVTELLLSTPVEEQGENYYGDGVIFVMSGGKLIRIEYTPGYVTDGIFTPSRRKIEKQQGEFVVPEEDKEYEPHIYTPDDNPEFTPSFKDKQSIEDEHVTDGGYHRKDFFAQQWKDLLLYILKQDKKQGFYRLISSREAARLRAR